MRVRSTGIPSPSLALIAVLLLCPAVSWPSDGDSLGIDLSSNVFDGQPHAIALAGTVAFVGNDTGIESVDVSQPASPQSFGTPLYLPSPAHRLVVAGSLLYAACLESGLFIVDISNPAALTVVSHFPSTGTNDVAVSGNLACLAEAGPSPAEFGIRVIDVTDPAAPVEISFLPLSNGALDVLVAGATAYVGLGSDPGGPHGLAVVDLATPALPSQSGFFGTIRPVLDIALSGSAAFLGTGAVSAGEIVTVDVGSPTSPSLVSTFTLTSPAYGLALSGSTLGIANGAAGLRLIDVSNPPSLTSLGALKTPTGDDAVCVEFAGSVALVGVRGYSLNGMFATIETAPPTAPTFLGGLEYSDTVDAAAVGNTAYFLKWDGLFIFDMSNPRNPWPVGAWTVPGAYLTALDVEGNVAAVAEGRTVHLVDLTDPTLPVLLGDALLDSGWAHEPVLEGNTLFVENGTGYEAFDVTNPASPFPVGAYQPGAASDLAVVGNTAYLATFDALEILDVSAPGSPSLLGTYAAGFPLSAVAVDGTTAVLTGFGDAIHLVDLSNPSSPAFISRIAGPGGFDIAFSGSNAFVAAGEDGILGVSLVNPASPVVGGYFDTSGFASAVAVSGNAIYAATASAQGWVFGCVFCTAACVAEVAVTPPGPLQTCEGVPVTFTVDIQQLFGCPSGPGYRWYVDGALDPAATLAQFDSPAALSLGAHTVRGEAYCPAYPACTDWDEVAMDVVSDTYPTIVANSLLLSPLPQFATLYWQASGTGDFNIGRTNSKPGLGNPPITTFATSSVATFVDPEIPLPTEVFYYQVYGRGSCTETSYP